MIRSVKLKFVTLLLLLLLADSKSLNFLKLKYVRKICSLKVTLFLQSTYHLVESEVSQIFFNYKCCNGVSMSALGVHSKVSQPAKKLRKK